MTRTRLYTNPIVRAVVATLVGVASVAFGTGNPSVDHQQGVAGAFSASATPSSVDAANSALLDAPTIRMPAHAPHLPILTNRSARLRAISHVRFELLLVDTSFGVSEHTTTFVHELYSRRTNPVEAFIVLPGTPPPSCLG